MVYFQGEICKHTYTNIHSHLLFTLPSFSSCLTNMRVSGQCFSSFSEWLIFLFLLIILINLQVCNCFNLQYNEKQTPLLTPCSLLATIPFLCLPFHPKELPYTHYSLILLLPSLTDPVIMSRLSHFYHTSDATPPSMHFMQTALDRFISKSKGCSLSLSWLTCQ